MSHCTAWLHHLSAQASGASCHTAKHSHATASGIVLRANRGLVTGPGLAVRVLGDVTEGDALDVLRHVDEVYVQTIRDYGLYDKIWQAFAVFLPVRCGPFQPFLYPSAAASCFVISLFDAFLWFPFLPFAYL